MPIIEVTFDRAIAQPPLRVEVGDVIQPDVDHFVATLRGMVENGSRFKTGQTLQIGWLWLKFIDDGEGWLAVHEPDFPAPPPAPFVPGVTRTLKTLRLQKMVPESFGLDGDHSVQWVESCIVCTASAKGTSWSSNDPSATTLIQPTAAGTSVAAMLTTTTTRRTTSSAGAFTTPLVRSHESSNGWPCRLELGSGSTGTG